MKTIQIISTTRILGILLLLAVFQSCSTTPIIGGKEPFIVTKIVKIDELMSEYSSHSNAGYGANGFCKSPSILLPSKLYNIGDTVKVFK